MSKAAAAQLFASASCATTVQLPMFKAGVSPQLNAHVSQLCMGMHWLSRTVTVLGAVQLPLPSSVAVHCCATLSVACCCSGAAALVYAGKIANMAKAVKQTSAVCKASIQFMVF